jgi:hypothetical protein
MLHRLFIVMLMLSLAPAAMARQIATLEVFPSEVNLTTAADHQSLVVLATYDDGTTRDVTSESQFAFADAAFAKLHEGAVLPVADGQTQLAVTFDGKTVQGAVGVKDATAVRPISFRLDVMPVFMKTGCNTGSCHGSARGQDGFHLSLFGYDPEGDYYRITREMGARRINLAQPVRSLLVEKSIGVVPHTGGERFTLDSEHAQTLIDWLEGGAPNDSADVAIPVSMEILPRQIVLEGENATQQMTVRAYYSDGTDRDVTSLAVFMSNNDNSATVSPVGVVTANKRGEAFVMARFATFTEGTQVIVIPEGLDYKRPEYPANNYIDELVGEKLHKLRIEPSELCSDEVFIRRAFLDITATLPTAEEYAAFMADESPDKRDKLVDDLLSRKAFTELWVMKWAELLQIRTDDVNGVSYKATLLYYNWLEQRIANNVPFNQIVRELLSARGGTFTNPSTNYYQIERDTLKVTENVAQVFMGMRIQCAQCHNHPFDRWTMDDYYSFAAFFTQVGRKKAEDPRETIVFNNNSGEMKNPVDDRVMTPKFLGGDTPEMKRWEDRREVLADWLASPDNPYFARNLANMVWAHFYGVGIIEPVDDVRISNPASNPQLLDALAAKFTEYNYDFKQLVRDICTSRTYQLASRTNETNAGDTLNFSHARIRRVRAETLLDIISQVTATKNKFQGLPLGARAVQIADGNVSNYFLTTFGRATRETVCSCEVKVEPNLSQALHLLNGDVTQKRIIEGGLIKQWLDAEQTPPQIIESLYVATLSRKPTEKEMTDLAAAIAAESDNAQQVLEDIFWALLNSKEFIFNH